MLSSVFLGTNFLQRESLFALLINLKGSAACDFPFSESDSLRLLVDGPLSVDSTKMKFH